MSNSKDDEKTFNETLKRMLKSPPKPHEKAAKDKGQSKPKKEKPAKRGGLSDSRC